MQKMKHLLDCFIAYLFKGHIYVETGFAALASI